MYQISASQCWLETQDDCQLRQSLVRESYVKHVIGIFYQTPEHLKKHFGWINQCMVLYNVLILVLISNPRRSPYQNKVYQNTLLCCI